MYKGSITCFLSVLLIYLMTFVFKVSCIFVIWCNLWTESQDMKWNLFYGCSKNVWMSTYRNFCCSGQCLHSLIALGLVCSFACLFVFVCVWNSSGWVLLDDDDKTGKLCLYCSLMTVLKHVRCHQKITNSTMKICNMSLRFNDPFWILLRTVVVSRGLTFLWSTFCPLFWFIQVKIPLYVGQKTTASEGEVD